MGVFSIDNSLQLWRLLVTITLRKARKAWRLNTAEQGDVQREAGQHAGNDWLFAALSREPTAVEALVLADEINSLLDGLWPGRLHSADARIAAKHAHTNCAMARFRAVLNGMQTQHGGPTKCAGSCVAPSNATSCRPSNQARRSQLRSWRI